MKAVICGAGIAGLALARCLDQRGWQVIVLEQAAGPRGQGYMIDFFGAGWDAASSMGVLPRIRELGYHVAEAVYVDRAGRRRASLSYHRFAKAVHGGLVSIMRPDLECALREGLSTDVELRFATSLSHIDNQPDRVRLTLTDGDILDADLLVGADGIHSAVRQRVFGPEPRYRRYLGFHTAAFTFEDPAIHADTRERFCLTDTIERQMGFYGLRDGRVAVFAVHRAPDPVLPRDARTALRREYASLGWEVPRALTACPPSLEVYYDQVAQIEMPGWSRGRVTLVGDACHAVSLLAGQGASLGIAGAYLLAEQLARTGSIEVALDRYERLWRPVVLEKQHIARGMVRWFLPRSQSQLRARRFTLALARLPGLDRYLAASLAGKPITIIHELGTTGPAPTQ
jgi:2-polyprenyl-6-methoxyphenol hydroxylase-like FAD-dependent oxidoreductase